jgi:uncharacterized protein (DUF4415 family)
MPRKPADTQKPWIDPDDGEEWTDEMLKNAVLTEGDKVIPRRKIGRPKSATTKTLVTLRLDPDVLQIFRETGRGWQSRINATLREHSPRGKPLGDGAKASKPGKRRA